MGWLPLALTTGALVALRDATVKGGPAHLDGYAAAFAMCGTTAVVLTGLHLVIGFPPLGPGLRAAVLGSAVPNLFAYVLLAGAVRRSDLSLVSPLLGLTPLFLLITSPLILGERVPPTGMVGVLLIVAGAYLLNLGDIRRGVLEPFRSLLRDPGARMMLGVALLWSISSNYDRVGIEATTPLAWPLVVNGFVALVLAPVVLWRRAHRAERRDGALLPWMLVGAGVLNAAQSITHMLALTLTLVPYVVAVKRTSLLFSVGLGWILFGERRIGTRVVGAAIIVAGVAVFTLAS